jgi:hypothetical protein
MDFLTLAILSAMGGFALNAYDQRQRIALLSGHLGNYQLEKLMESLTQGYLRALGEKDAERRDQIWGLLGSTEAQLVSQFERFANEFAKVDAELARVSTLPAGLPYASRWWPQASFDLRSMFKLHAQGLARAVENRANQSARDKAFTVSAELFLMQHSCHWFCKSKNVASARLLVRHQTAYAQVLDAVGSETRTAYDKLVNG